MIKLLIFIKRKPGTTIKEFRNHYETSHAPLISRHLQQYFTDYRRSYIDLEDEYTFMGPFNVPDALGSRPNYDVLTEIWIPDRKALEEMYVALREPAVAAEIEQDELRFMDRSATQVIVADEEISPR